jgi:hypothetical protein
LNKEVVIVKARGCSLLWAWVTCVDTTWVATGRIGAAKCACWIVVCACPSVVEKRLGNLNEGWLITK